MIIKNVKPKTVVMHDQSLRNNRSTVTTMPFLSTLLHLISNQEF